MRFVPDGPDIPNDLIKKWREGSVLFLAGAGVSVPSSLPLFEGLALDVYKALNDDLYSVLSAARKRKTPAARKRILEAAHLSPGRQVEATLFLEKQFDRFFSALERRYDPDTKGRTKTRHVRNAVEKYWVEKPTAKLTAIFFVCQWQQIHTAIFLSHRLAEL